MRIKKASEMKEHIVEKPYEIITYFGPPGKVSGNFGSLEITWGTTWLSWFKAKLSFEADSAEGSHINYGAASLPLMNLNEARFFLSSE